MKLAQIELVLLAWLWCLTNAICSAEDNQSRSIADALQQLSQASGDSEFRQVMKQVESVAREKPREFAEEIVDFASAHPGALEAWWLPQAAVCTGADDLVLEVAIAHLDSTDKQEVLVAEDIIKAISTKNTQLAFGQQGTAYKVTFAGLSPLISAKTLTPSLVELLYREDLYASFEGLWRMNLASQSVANRDQPRKDLMLLLHLAQDLEFRRSYGFPLEPVQSELSNALEAAAKDDAWWVRSFVAKVKASMQKPQ
ncbi:MAG: hypothetical protein U0795_19465 [Pirellulales bacterium]